MMRRVTTAKEGLTRGLLLRVNAFGAWEFDLRHRRPFLGPHEHGGARRVADNLLRDRSEQGVRKPTAVVGSDEDQIRLEVTPQTDNLLPRNAESHVNAHR